jgi:hypothetical protein
MLFAILAIVCSLGGWHFRSASASGLRGARPESPAPPIDFLAYALKADNSTGLATGDGFVWHQVVTGSDYYLEKWTNPQQIVHYWYDDTNIYMGEDTTAQYPYKFHPGIWARRHMRIGEVVDMTGNQIALLDKTCGISQAGLCPYRNTLEAHYPQYDLGGDLGVQDVIVLRYAWGAPDFANVEREYYARGFGIVKWEWWTGNQLMARVLTNLVARYAPVPINPACPDTDHGPLRLDPIGSPAANPPE